MARIRTIKPEFFVDEELQDLEASNPGMYCMLVFAGLWGHCSKEGVFEYRPRMLKLSILPFLDFSLENTLELLVQAGFVGRFSVDGKEYGHVRSFEKHQRISGKEANYSPKMPSPERGKHRGSTGEAPGKQCCYDLEISEVEQIVEEENNSCYLNGLHSPDRGSTGEAPGKHYGYTGEAQEREKEREKEREGGSGNTPREGFAEPAPPPSPPLGVDGEVMRIKNLHLLTCGLTTVPPMAIVRDILQRGIPPDRIDDVYQACGGDVPKYRQRNIVERLTALRDGKALPGTRKARDALSRSALRQAKTIQAARDFVGG